MEALFIFFSQAIFCVFKTIIIYTTMRGEKHKTATIAVVLGALNLAAVYLGVKAVADGDVIVVLAYLAGNYIGTYFSTNNKNKQDAGSN